MELPLQVGDALDRELWAMADEPDRQRRALSRTRLILFSCLFAGFAAAGAVIVHSQTWAALLVAFLLVTVAGPGAGLAIDAAANLLARRRRSTAPIDA